MIATLLWRARCGSIFWTATCRVLRSHTAAHNVYGFNISFQVWI
uniref:Uncharacterized protein n=1 Tax=Arundo donax TaxID=35708 RepID=A0A0A9F1K8_ARUDO